MHLCCCWLVQHKAYTITVVKAGNQEHRSFLSRGQTLTSGRKEPPLRNNSWGYFRPKHMRKVMSVWGKKTKPHTAEGEPHPHPPHPSSSTEQRHIEEPILCPHLAAEIIVGYIQSEKRLQAWGLGEAVLQEEAVLLCTEERHHWHFSLSRMRATQC